MKEETVARATVFPSPCVNRQIHSPRAPQSAARGESLSHGLPGRQIVSDARTTSNYFARIARAGNGDSAARIHDSRAVRLSPAWHGAVAAHNVSVIMWRASRALSWRGTGQDTREPMELTARHGAARARPPATSLSASS